MKKLTVFALTSLILTTALTAYKLEVVQPQKIKAADKAPQGSTYAVQTAVATQAAAKEQEKPVTAAASYEGQIDSNSIEVKIDNKPVALFFSESVKASFKPGSFTKGAKVEVTYYKNDKGQLILTSVKNLSASAAPKISTDITATGVYVGQMDSNSIEIKINNKAEALFFSEEVKKTFGTLKLKSGSKVRITYLKNDKGQLILKSIKGI